VNSTGASGVHGGSSGIEESLAEPAAPLARANEELGHEGIRADELEIVVEGGDCVPNQGAVGCLSHKNDPKARIAKEAKQRRPHERRAPGNLLGSIERLHHRKKRRLVRRSGEPDSGHWFYATRGPVARAHGLRRSSATASALGTLHESESANSEFGCSVSHSVWAVYGGG
jgi:hypothetical protein